MSEAILEAARSGDLEKIRELLAGDPSLLNARNERGQSAVLLALYHRKPEAVEALLAAGPELNVWEAAALGREERVRELIAADRGAVGSFAPDGFFPLGLAAYFGHPKIVEMLLEAGADVNAAARNEMAVQAIHAAASTRQFGIAKVLIAYGADVNARHQNGYTPLHAAALNGDVDMVRLFLEYGAHRLSRTDNGQCALDFALTKGHAAVAQLLEQG